MSNTTTLQIPKDVIEPIIQARVSAALLEVFGNQGALLDRIVQSVLQQKVDSEGRPSNSSYGSQETTLQYLAHKAIRDATLEALREVLEQHKQKVKDALVAELKRPKSNLLDKLASSMIDSMCETAKSAYRVTVTYAEKK